MYNPPSEIWFAKGQYKQEYRNVYTEGYAAAQSGKSEKDNPYYKSRTEKATEEEWRLDYWWNVGYNDYCGS
jgi:hypothetical protein